MNDEEPFLKRWSRRKIEAKEGPDAAGAEAVADADARGVDKRTSLAEPSPAQPEAEAQEKRQLTEADFADVDFAALDGKSDYTRFLQAGVPDSIRNKALRRMWACDTVFTTPDPFQDYLGDYTDAAVAVPAGTLKTAYRIGKGFMTDEEVAVWEKLGHPEVAEVAAKSPASETAAAAGAAVGAPAADADAPVAIAAEPADQPEVHALLRQSDAYHATLYPAESNHLIDVAALSQPNVRFVVARRGGVAVGCGGLVLGGDGEAELKRMFVTPEARGRRIGSQILDALEAAGKAEVVRVIRLETGVRQPESLALYRRHGYTERGPFGVYQRDPLSRYFEKWVG
jgi:putative acetyltransferase